MTGTGGTGRRWAIGELARASGMTVRALRHYDEIGLLTASERTPTGHRRYTERDLRRLYRIRALRALGLSLPEIAGALARPADDLASIRDLLAGQLRRLDEHAERIRRLRHRILGLRAHLDGSSPPDPEQFMRTLEMMSVFDAYFTARQRDQLARRRAGLGPEVVEAAKREWVGLVEEGLRHLDAGTPVDDPGVRDLVRRWDALGDAFHVGEQTKVAARRMWRDGGAELSRGLPWPAERLAGLVSYLEQVRRSV